MIPAQPATPLTQTTEWRDLLAHSGSLPADLAEVLLADPQRAQNCALVLGGLRFSYAFNRATPDTIAKLARLAEARDLPAWRAAMWRGEKINQSENRAALHVALRTSAAAGMAVYGQDVLPLVRAMRERVSGVVRSVRDGSLKGATGKNFRHVVNIGIGGSDLGPRMAVGALAEQAKTLQTHFVANADAFELEQLMRYLDPAETLFVVVSKTFTTQETLINAQAARAWIIAHLGPEAVTRHFAAVSTNPERIAAFGISPDMTFPMWDWVGGRFSLWSAVGLTLALAIGNEAFAELLRGAEAMDIHFRDAPLERNIPVVMAMLGIWSRNILNCAAHAVLPYCERLRELPRYLQQLEMESNGKSVGRDGKPVDVATTPVLFGEPGTVGQHGFHQWLHQATDIISADFIGILHDDFARPENHRALLSNMVAQAGVLAFGQADAAKPHEIYPGNRGSNMILLNRLDPYHLGMLLALYEHKVFAQSVIWGINPFDQPGVELGKRMAGLLARSEAIAGPGGLFMADAYRRMGLKA